MILPCTAIVELCGSRWSRAAKCQERFLIIKLLFLIIKQSYLEEFLIIRSARKPSNLTPRNWAGTSLSNPVTSQNPEMTIPSRKLMATVSLYLVGLSQEQESTRPTYAQKMEVPWNGNALVRIVRVSQLLGLLKALHITKASCTFLEVWWRTMKSFKIFGSST